MNRRWAPWVVRTIWIGGLALILLFAFGARTRADRAYDQVAKVRSAGTPSDVLTKAQQAVSVWAGRPAVVISVAREQDHWRAQAMAGPNCYELAVSKDKVSGHPGLVPCPAITAAGVGDDQLATTDDRRPVIASFLGAWLTGDITAPRYLADDTPAFALPAELASRVSVMNLWGDDASSSPGTKSLVTATADVSYPSSATRGARIESQAWTFLLVHGETRWSIKQMAGGEVPSGDKADLKLGWTPDTTLPTTTQGD